MSNDATEQQQFNLIAADGGQTSVLRIGPDDASRNPVIMIPGMFTAHGFWISPAGIGLAAHLAEAGHSCYLIDRRAVGDSPRLQDGPRCGLDEHVAHDLPELAAEVTRREGRPAFWMGHSFGGIMASLALASGRCGEPAGLVLFATQYAVDKKALTWPYSLATRGLAHLMGRVPARRVGLGPEDESPAALDDACKWVRRGRGSNWLTDQLAKITCPALEMVGVADRVDPPAGCEQFLEALGSQDKQFQIAGLKTGFAADYDHPGIVVNRAAREDIWPRIARWLAENSPPN